MPRSNNICNSFPSSQAARFRLLCAILLYARMPSTDPAVMSRALRGNPLSRSLLGAKRTCPFAPHMSANDPKRTLPTPDRLSRLARHAGGPCHEREWRRYADWGGGSCSRSKLFHYIDLARSAKSYRDCARRLAVARVLNAPISIPSGLGLRNWATPRGRIS
jgi:hypothetical protein